MSHDRLLEELSRLARRELGFEGRLHPGTALIEALELDSVRAMTLVVAVENHFRIRLEEGEEAELTTAGELARLIASRRGRPPREEERESE